jgi:hypothetical protein
MAMLNGCSSNSSSADAPPDLKVVAGDSSATLTWTADPDVEYWIFYAKGTTVTTANWLSLGGSAITKVTSPYVVGGLLNGTTYSFTINGRKNGGPGGVGAPSQVATPRLAGTIWTVLPPVGTGRLNGVSVATTTVVSVGAGGTIFSSVNGATATAQTNPAAPAELNAVLNGGLGFAAVGAAGTVVFTSDALTWATKTSGTVADLFAVASPGTGSFAAVGAAGAIITSGDGTTWTVATSPTTKNLYSAVYGNAKYVAVGAEGTLITSTDGVTWQSVATNTSRDLRAVAFGSYVTTVGTTTTTTTTFVALGAAGTLLTSSDGVTWTLQPAMSTNNIASVVYGGQFVAVGNSGSIFTSADGITWQTQTSGTTNDLTAVARTATGYVAVGAAGTYLTSQ